MADFRTKLMMLAGVATMFAGVAHAQVNCTDAAVSAAAGTPTANAVFLRAEGKTEQVADMTFKCDTSTALAGVSTMSVTVYLSPAVTISSVKVGSGGGAVNETTASASVNGGAATVTNGTISANSVSFTVATPATVAGTMAITITNIKIDATAVATGSGVPTSITETVFVGGTGAVPAVLGTTPSVAFVTAGIGSIKTSGTTANAICNAITSAAANFSVGFTEGFGNALKLGGTAAGNAVLNSWFTGNTETGFGVTAGGGTNTATSATRIKVIFNNIPANVAIYVPLQIWASDAPAQPSAVVGGSMYLTSSETAAFSAVTASTANGAPAASGALTVSSGSATAIYEYRGSFTTAQSAAAATGASDASQEVYSVPVYLVANAGAVAGPSSAITATVSFAPIGAASNVPNFVNGASTTTANGSTFSACSTSLLFPFVTNQLGFDTGVAISNTSSDLLGINGKTGAAQSAATAASGTCTLTFFGGATNPAAVTTASIASGTTYAAAVSGLAAGFQGYMIANCNFLYGHGFAYVVYNLTQNNGAAMGYLADVIQADRKSIVGGEVGVGTTTPESAGH